MPPSSPSPFTPGLILNTVACLVFFGLAWAGWITLPESLGGLIRIYYAVSSYVFADAMAEAGILSWCIKGPILLALLPFAILWQGWCIFYDAITRARNANTFMSTLDSESIKEKISTMPKAVESADGRSKTDVQPTDVQLVSTYRYEALAPDEIRLLELFPAEDSSRLRGRIVRAHLAELPRYTALSYCWNDLSYPGGARSRVDPVLDLGEDGTLVITRNLSTCLQCAQKKGSLGSRLLWIDQICINQQDLAEKSVQVALMKDIYRQAALVLVWLGDDTPTGNGERALRFADRIAALIDDKHLLSPDFDFFPFLFKSNNLGIPPVHTAAAEYMFLVALLTRPWFARSWVVQEVALGGNPASEKRVLVGDTETSFDALAKALLFCTTSIEYVADRVPVETREACRAMIQSSIYAKRDRERPSSALLDILTRHRGCQATLGRDKVFAFLNLADDVDALGIRPDYTVCTRKVMTDTAVAMLTHYDNLDMLSSAYAWPGVMEPRNACMDGSLPCPQTEHGPDLPSWVPDWSVSTLAPSFQLKGEFGEYFSSYRATDGAAKEVQFRKDNTQLGLKGHLVDRIVAMGPVFHEGLDMKLGTHYTIMKSWGDMCGAWDSRAKPYITGQPMRTVLAETVTCGGRDVTMQSARPSSSDKDPFGDADFTSQFNQLMAVFRINWLVDTIWPGVSDRRPLAYNLLFTILGMPILVWLIVLSKLGLGLPLATVSSGFRRRFFASVKYRRLIRTEHGFIGLAPLQVELNDCVGLFAGGAAPLVVRPVMNPEAPEEILLRVVGDAYLHGFMFGHAWGVGEPRTMWFC